MLISIYSMLPCLMMINLVKYHDFTSKQVFPYHQKTGRPLHSNKRLSSIFAVSSIFLFLTIATGISVLHYLLKTKRFGDVNFI